VLGPVKDAPQRLYPCNGVLITCLPSFSTNQSPISTPRLVSSDE
jgi:hypothetical protein